MAGDSSVIIGWSWTEVSVLGSQVFGQASMESCELLRYSLFIYFNVFLEVKRVCKQTSTPGLLIIKFV